MGRQPLHSESYYRAVYVTYPRTLRKLSVIAACACVCHLDYIQGSGTSRDEILSLTSIQLKHNLIVLVQLFVIFASFTSVSFL